MSDRPPVSGDGEAPAALLLVRPGPDARLLAADTVALRWAGSSAVPQGLEQWRHAAGLLSPGSGPDPWLDVAAGRAVPGRALPDGHWLYATPAGPDGELLLAVTAATPSAGPALLPDPGLVLLRRRGTGPEAARGTVRPVAHPAQDTVGLTSSFEVVWASAAFSRATGTSLSDALGRRLPELVGEAAPTFWKDADRRVAHGEAISTRVLDRRADGAAFLHRIHLAPLLDHDGEVAYLVSRHADMTTTILAEEQLRGARVAADTADRRLDLIAQLDEAATEASAPLAVEAVTAVLRDAGIVREALVMLTVDRPGGPRSGAAEIVAAVGPVFSTLRGRRLGVGARDRAGDPWLRRVARPAPSSFDVDPATAPGAPSALLAAVLRDVLPGEEGVAPVVWALSAGSADDVVGLLVVVPTDAVRAGGGPAGPAPRDASILVAAARRIGVVLDRTRWQARETELAQTLQRSLLPTPPDVDGLEVWTHYAASGDHAQVGGDWYDVLQTSLDHVGIVIGDVVGHDAEAAAAMGQMRSAVRSSVHDLDDPGSVLMRVDQLSARLDISRMASLVYASLQRLDDGEWEVSWSSAGHLPPLLRRVTGRVEVLSDGTGTLVGLGGRPRPTRHRALVPGDTLVFYTDGLIETRSRPMHDGLAALIDAVRDSTAATAAGLGEDLLRVLGQAAEDDAAVVVVRVPSVLASSTAPSSTADPDPDVVTPRRRRWLLTADPSSIGKARHATLRACAAWGLDVGPQAEMVVSELVANAVLHGWGDVGLRLFDLSGPSGPSGPSGCLRIEVEDDSPEMPRVVDARLEGTGGHGMRVVESLGRWGTDRTPRGKIVWVEIPIPS